MFGYVTANKPELKMREFGRYKAFYCGLCRRLGKNNGAVSRLTLSYDMTFLILLLSSLYEPEEQQERHRCLIHPGKKQWMIYNQITDYASDMNVLLSCYHFQDDWEDERSIAGFCGAKVFAGRAKKIAGQYPRQSKVIREQLGRLAELEQKGITEPDAISRPFGELMSELFVYREDAFQDILRSFGFYLGKYIYLLDAFMDLEKDLKKGSFNPFRESTDREDFEESVRQMLEGTIRQAVAEFEKLPLEQDLPILRNILYEGVKLPLMRGENDDKRSI
ncbi:MAG: hypothetical protein HFG35_06630 [Eubacterium sp.]|jgi:hypothetical protein|nr:hypothetical protein [Eubacterium sp.]